MNGSRGLILAALWLGCGSPPCPIDATDVAQFCRSFCNDDGEMRAAVNGRACPRCDCASLRHEVHVCDASRAERLEVARQSQAQASDGFTIAFEGVTIDEFDDGSTQWVSTFRLSYGGRVENWLPNMGPAPPTVIFEHCVRIQDSNEERAIFELAPASIEMRPGPDRIDWN
jgi:hypothetical protein